MSVKNNLFLKFHKAMMEKRHNLEKIAHNIPHVYMEQSPRIMWNRAKMRGS